MAIDAGEPTLTISLSRKLNLGNYESAEAFVSISGVRAGMTAQDIEPLLTTGKMAWEQVRRALLDGLKKARDTNLETGGRV